MVRIKHGYDRVGNRLYREDVVSTANNKNFDELYAYDGINQLVDMQRGTINSAKTGVTAKKWQDQFAFDATGNWQTFKQDTDGNGTWETNQTRTHNKANEIATIGGSSSNTATDANGNMTKIVKPDVWNAAFTCVFDAWNRMVQVKDGTTTVASYSYNGLDHRVKKVVGSTTTTSFFNSEWQELESKTGNDTIVYVWGLRYIDDLLFRDKDSVRLYSLADPNWNVVALTNVSGAVQERIAYNAFGKASWLDASFGAKSASLYSCDRTFTGQVLDAESGLMLYRNRFYHTGVGRFVTRDPVGYEADDINLFRYVTNNPPIYGDVYGEDEFDDYEEQTNKENLKKLEDIFPSIKIKTGSSNECFEYKYTISSIKRAGVKVTTGSMYNDFQNRENIGRFKQIALALPMPATVSFTVSQGCKPNCCCRDKKQDNKKQNIKGDSVLKYKRLALTYTVTISYTAIMSYTGWVGKCGEC